MKINVDEPTVEQFFKAGTELFKIPCKKDVRKFMLLIF